MPASSSSPAVRSAEEWLLQRRTSSPEVIVQNLVTENQELRSKVLALEAANNNLQRLLGEVVDQMPPQPEMDPPLQQRPPRATRQQRFTPDIDSSTVATVAMSRSGAGYILVEADEETDAVPGLYREKWSQFKARICFNKPDKSKGTPRYRPDLTFHSTTSRDDAAQKWVEAGGVLPIPVRL